MSRHVTRRIAFVVMFAAAWTEVSAQVSFVNIQVSEPDPTLFQNREPTIVASPVNPGEVLVAWIATSSLARVHYRVSTTGFLGPMPPSPSILPIPNVASGCGACTTLDQSADPVVATSRHGPVTGDLFVGALFQYVGPPPAYAFGIARKRLGDGDLEPLSSGVPLVRYATNCSLNNALDRPSLAAGPWPPALPPPGPNKGAMYFTYRVKVS